MFLNQRSQKGWGATNTNSQIPQNARCTFCSPIPISFPQARPGWACAVREKRDQGRALFEPQASLRGPPLFLRSAGCP